MKNSLATLCFAVVTATAVPAQAIVITQTFNFPTTSFSGGGLPDPTFNQWNPILGPLRSVTVTLQSTITGTTTITRTCNSTNCTNDILASQFSGGTTRSVTLDLPPTTSDLSLQNVNAWNTGFTNNLTSGGHQSQSQSVNSGLLSTSIFDDTLLGAYVGLGTITFLLNGVVTSNIALPPGQLPITFGNSSYSITTTGLGSGIVTLAYEAPEPTTLSLLGIGLLGLGALARRRRQTASQALGTQ